MLIFRCKCLVYKKYGNNWWKDLSDWSLASLASIITLPFVVPHHVGGTREYKSVNHFIEQKEVIAFFLQVSIIEFYVSVYRVWEEEQYLWFMTYCNYIYVQFSTDYSLPWKVLIFFLK